MIRMAPNTPTAFAYFEVHVPIRDGLYTEDAERIVDRYLYNGFTRGEVTVSPSVEHYIVPVTYADYRVPNSGTALEQAQGSVETQRDRLASGMYRATEPTYYLPVEVTA